MLITVNEVWPQAQIDAIRRIDMELSQKNLPDYVKKCGLKIVPTGSFIKACSLYEVQNGQEQAGISAVQNFFECFSNIDGYYYTIEW